MDRPVIGILGMRTIDASGNVPVMRDFTNAAYCAAVQRGGGIPLLIPATTGIDDVDRLLACCQGLLLPGGIDVDPRLYHEDPLPVLGEVDLQTDRLWMTACMRALELGLPILGICRGLQLVNVALGGSLYQDLAYANPQHLLHAQKQNRDYLMHRIDIDAASRVARILGTTSLYTNTLHHQCVKEAGRGLTVIARTSDGIPEALESADGQIVLVQWHPEELLESEPRMLGLFTDLVERAQG
ncbi:gamma-glutamyl-gamma-aminobutyrate hydrolase family protein [Collinsella ihumii]|uniref:gamma-glutamyl-gamma-aminobutyrate hydrolase family protein n=1 Tax=Collinsella ihumii TaxID=1720204 RepID=UPI0025AB2B48|nr:gamma-glutamyl-gamma-aminobutyrate hydrolase family protein [Collinsella ihumii]MDN0054802.1 gamma-glutamyl-gamma-aminobutyrate hydrolase family protein [Collinsella ihumii]